MSSPPSYPPNANMSYFDFPKTVTCASFVNYCEYRNTDCLEKPHVYYYNSMNASDVSFSFKSMAGFDSECLTCTSFDVTHSTIIFNAFIFCQFFNEYSSRILNDDLNMFVDISNNYMFLVVSVITFAIQVLLISKGGRFVQTTPLTIYQWLITIALGAITIPVGVLMRLIPVKEDEKSFYSNPFLQTQVTDDASNGVNGGRKLIKPTSSIMHSYVFNHGRGVRDYLASTADDADVEHGMQLQSRDSQVKAEYKFSNIQQQGDANKNNKGNNSRSNADVAAAIAAAAASRASAMSNKKETPALTDEADASATAAAAAGGYTQVNNGLKVVTDVSKKGAPPPPAHRSNKAPATSTDSTTAVSNNNTNNLITKDSQNNVYHNFVGRQPSIEGNSSLFSVHSPEARAAQNAATADRTANAYKALLADD